MVQLLFSFPHSFVLLFLPLIFLCSCLQLLLMLPTVHTGRSWPRILRDLSILCSPTFLNSDSIACASIFMTIKNFICAIFWISGALLSQLLHLWFSFLKYAFKIINNIFILYLLRRNGLLLLLLGDGTNRSLCWGILSDLLRLDVLQLIL